jgi:hypothetical protein
VTAWRGLLLAVVLGAVCWLMLAWSLAHKGDLVGVTTVEAKPSQEHAAHVRVAEVTTLWRTLAEQAVVDEFLREHAEQERQKARRAAQKARSARLKASSVQSSGRCGGDLPPCSVMMCESGGSLTARNPRSSASGKWQILRSTWAGFGGYAEAWLAPEAVQDAKARQLWAGGRGAFHWRSCL